jgi:hypothetical protein
MTLLIQTPYTSTCLQLSQYVEAVVIHNLLDLVLPNFADLKCIPADCGLVTSDTYHPRLNIDALLPDFNNNLNSQFSYQIYAGGNYILEYSFYV